MEAAMVKTIIRTDDGMVMVFDERGEQVPEYQGNYDDVREKVLARASGESGFYHWFGASERPQNVPAERW
jgi:hypothetical protein